VADTLIDHLSKGYRQRVGLADAIVARPPLLVLDEPTAGMDPNQIREVRAMIRELGAEHTVLVSTHILHEVEATCSRVVVIDRGKLVAEGTPAELAELRRPPRFTVLVRDGQPGWLDALAEHVTRTSIEPLDGGSSRVHYAVSAGHDVGLAIEAQIAALVDRGVGVREVSPAKASLEDVFASLTHSDGHSDGHRDDGPRDGPRAGPESPNAEAAS
jgi:ABC-2 type transport system ATP-binding protein